MAALALAACAQEPGTGEALPERAEALTIDPASGSMSEPPPTSVVDSVFPIEEEIRRFRMGLPEAAAFSDGARDRDELVARFLAAVEAADTAAFVPLLLTRAEFAYLYYPHTMYTQRPYELSPAFLWFQMQNLSSRGLTRLLRAFGGRPLRAAGYRCEEEPALEGPNRVWKECRVLVREAGGDPAEARLFGSIVERAGTYKFVSYSNGL